MAIDSKYNSLANIYDEKSSRNVTHCHFKNTPTSSPFWMVSSLDFRWLLSGV